MTILASAALCFAAEAQSDLKKVYDESIDPMTQIDKAIAKADKDGKFVICQVGGNWCRWCLMFADFISKDSEITELIDKNFEYVHVNYNPRERNDEAKMKKAWVEYCANKAVIDQYDICRAIAWLYVHVEDAEFRKAMQSQLDFFVAKRQSV